MGISIELSCEAGSFLYHLNTHRLFQSEVLRFYFPHWNSGMRGLSHSPVVPSGLSTCKCGTTLSSSHHLTGSTSCCHASLPQLPVSAPPTGLVNCFFFNSLVVRLPYSSILGSSGCFFVFKFVVLLLVVRRVTVCLPMPPSWLEVLICISLMANNVKHLFL